MFKNNDQKKFKLRNYLTIALISSLFSCVIAYGFLFWKYSTPGLSLYEDASVKQTPEDQKTTLNFLKTINPKTKYDILTRYFINGFIKHSSENGALINYKGFPSRKGYHINGIEGFARTAPLVATWVNSNEKTTITVGEQSIELKSYLRTAILAGTNPEASDYWGDMKDYDQRIVEAADIAKVLWITRPYIWDKLSDTEKTQISNWLNQATTLKVWPNNWLLFPTVIKVIVNQLNNTHTPDTDTNYQKFKEFYTENGWFFDHPHGFDYYNSWGIPYDLFWITYVDEEFDKNFIRKAIEESAEVTKHLISPRGVPMIGRSVCYRTGIPSSILAHAILNEEEHDIALGSLNAIWNHFVEKGILLDNTMTQGYYKTDIRLLDSYTGPGSCHWGLRSLILAWMLPESFWNVTPKPLPVQQKSYFINLPKIGWTIKGNKKNHNITITVLKNHQEQYALHGPSLKEKIKSKLFNKPAHANNDAYKYHQRSYSVDAPPE